MHGPTVPGLLRSGSLRRPHPDPRVSAPRPNVGLLRRGNRNQTDTAPSPETRALWADLEPTAGGHLAPPQSRATVDRGSWRTAEEKKRRGGICPGCGVERPTSGQCGGCW